MVWIEHPGTVYSTQDNVYMCVHIHSGTLIWEVWLSLATRTLSICHGIPLQTRAIVNRITSMRRGRFGFSTNPVVGKSSIALGPVWMVSYVGNTLNNIPVQYYWRTWRTCTLVPRLGLRPSLTQSWPYHRKNEQIWQKIYLSRSRLDRIPQAFRPKFQLHCLK